MLWALALVFAVQASEAADTPAPNAAAPVDTVVVTGRKLTVETLIDRKVYSVATDVQSTFGSIGDVLSAIPFVDVDPDGVVSLRGDPNVLVLIDGKPSAQLSGASAGDALQSIPAADIERIEVLTTPPAQFKADGASGVINIVTRKKRPQGFVGSLQGSVGNSGRSVVGANASYSSSRVTAAATAGFREDYRFRSLQSDVRTPDPATTRLTDSRSELTETIRRGVPSVGTSVDVALNDRQSVSAAVNWSRRGGLRTYTETNDVFASTGDLIGSARRLSAGRDPESAFDGKLGFSQRFGRPGEVLDVSFHRSTARQTEHYEYVNDSFVPMEATQLNNLTFREDHDITGFTADYALPFSKTRTLKMGYAFQQDKYAYDSAGASVDPLSGASVPDPILTDDFRFRQEIEAGYVSYQTSTGAWNWLAGLRAELTRNTARQLTDNTAHHNSYVGAYSSFHVDRSLTDQSTLSFGASRRIRRPDFDNYNSFVDREFSPNLRAGNSDLRPQDTQAFEVGYGYDGRGVSYATTAYYRRNRNSLTDVTQYLGNGLSLTTKTNLSRNDFAGLEVTANGPLLPKLAYSVSGNLFYSQIDSTTLGLAGLQSTTGLDAKLKLDYRPSAVDSSQLTVTRTDRRLTPQGYVGAVNIANLGYRRQLRPDLVAIVTVSDLFNGQRVERNATTSTFTGDYLRSVRGRAVFVGLAYSYGSTKKEKQPTFDYDQPD